jgi:nitrite reductase/ring-hydroxylating ferredoxin subunit
MSKRTLVASEAEFDTNERIFVRVNTREIAVLRVGGAYYAYLNVCAHLGGPVCQGKLVPAVRAVVDARRAVVEERFDREHLRIVCPWHGWEFDLDTGRCVSNPSRKIRKYDVTVENGKVYVDA